ncbi:MAG: aldehyde dehydrogenase family protein [Leucobacter sp.]
MQTILQAHDAFLSSFDGGARIPGIDSTSLERFDVVDPATGAAFTQVSNAPIALADHCLEVAGRGLRAWSTQSARARSNVLLRAAELLLERIEIVAATMTREMGKPIDESRAEVRFSADYLRWYSEEAVRSYGGYREAPAGGARLIVTRQPVGIALLITPWNFPLAMGARKAAAALAAGCSVILKPAEATPLSSLLLGDVLLEAGVPPEAFQVVTTSDSSGWSRTLMGDARLKKVSFTGSTRVGSMLIEQSAQHVQKLSLELGGDAPFLVFNDADLERAVNSAVISKIRNGGQACVAANRFLVQDGIAAEFTAELSSRLNALTVGSGFSDGVDLGPLISGQAREQVRGLVDGALELGAEDACAAPQPVGEGFFMNPAVLTNVPESATIASAEIFAPIAVVGTFSTDAEAVAEANNTPFGLAGYVFSQDIDRAFGVAHALEVGVLGINKGLVADASSPFGGIGYSGYGKEGGIEGMQDFQTLKQFNLDSPAVTLLG